MSIPERRTRSGSDLSIPERWTPAHAERRRRGRGFTLLEVMVAVTMMAFVVTALTRAAVDGMRVEGEAHRRLRASLIADQLLADIESLPLQGATPEVGVEEDEQEEFGIRVETRPLDIARLGIQPEAGPDASPLAALVGSRSLGSSPPLLEVLITVSWFEGVDEIAVRRPTYSFDAAAVAALLPEDAGRGGDDPDLDDGDRDDPRDRRRTRDDEDER